MKRFWIKFIFADRVGSLVQRGFRKSGLCKILFSKNLDTKILITNRLAGQVSRWADRHCLDHDRAIRIRGARSDVTMGLWKTHPSRGSAKGGAKLLKDSEADVAGQRATWRRHDNRASRRAAGNDGGYVGVVQHGETGRGDAVEGHGGGTGQPLTEDLRRTTNSALRLHKRDKWTEAHIEAIDAPIAVDA